MNKIRSKCFDGVRILALFLLTGSLISCGGSGGGSSGGSGSGATPSAPLSSDQQLYETAELNGGASTVTLNMPYGGGNLVSGTNYVYATSTGGLSVSPSVAGPEFETPVVSSLDSALALPAIAPGRFLQAGQVMLRSVTAKRKISYVGTDIQVDYIADDGQTIVESAQFSDFSQVPLSGLIDNAPQELQAVYNFDDWVSANYFAANAKWQSGAAYLKRHGGLISDAYIAEDCNNTYPSTTTTTAATTPCQTGTTLSNIFPISLYATDGFGHPQETDFAADGTISTINGVTMWVANSPLPPVYDTPAYRVFYELNGNVYMGLLEKAGTAFLYAQTDGSVVNYTVTLNQAAVNSIQQGLITGAGVAGSQAGDTTGIPTVDLFGIGGHGINGALAPVDLQSTYAIPSTLTGAGQTVAIIAAPGSGNVADDLNVFSQNFNLPQCNGANPCFQHIDLSNGAPILPAKDWGVEPELDTQMVHAIAPGATIILVTASSNSQSDLFAAINYAAALPSVTAVTMSFTGVDVPVNLQNEDVFISGFQSNQGVAFFASSGDNGGLGPAGIGYPASSPFVTAVGGTRINSVARSLGAQSEVAWEFSGGGTSSYASMPAWQTSYLGAGSPIVNAGMRAVPDVAAVSDFQHSALAVYYKQRWVMSGGTSASSPIWAGVSALFAQHLANEGKSLATLVKNTPGGFNGILYQSKLTQGTNVGFFDVVSGTNNLVALSCTLCNAGPGYDEVTGLGTPTVANLLANF
jgi:hypothetical protein